MAKYSEKQFKDDLKELNTLIKSYKGGNRRDRDDRNDRDNRRNRRNLRQVRDENLSVSLLSRLGFVLNPITDTLEQKTNG